MEELLDLVDENNRVIGTALRSECHGDPMRMHRAVHLLVLNPERELYLQLRSPRKRVQPGKWDTSVGGHVGCGEDFVAALFREADEELALRDFDPCFMYNYIMRNEFECELVATFVGVTDLPLRPDPDEISEGRFWGEAEIASAMGGALFTPNFEDEYRRFLSWRRRNPRRYAALFQGECRDG